ncbi:MAG: amidohydrolase family protein [Candidatus Sulfotelmatobacter sp.]
MRPRGDPMHIDAHQHFWLYSPAEYEWIDNSMAVLRRDFLPEDLKPEMESNDFHGSVAVQARQTPEETRWLLDLAERSPWILGVVGWVDLRSPDVRSQLKFLARNPKLVGIRHIVQSEPDDHFLLQPDFLRGVSALEEFDLAYDILIYTKHLPVAAEFVERFPRQRFVLDHLAKPPIKSGNIDSWAQGISRLAAFPNVFCKLSGLVTEAEWRHWESEQIIPFLDVAFESFGPDRLMIGSDWPVCLVAASYAKTVEVVKSYLVQKKPECLDGVLGSNALRFWGLTVR